MANYLLLKTFAFLYSKALCLYRDIFFKESEKRIPLSFFWPSLEAGPFFKSVQYRTELDCEQNLKKKNSEKNL